VGIKEELQLGPRAELTKVCQNLRKPGKNPLFGELPRGIRVSLLARLDRQETTRCSHPLYFLQSDAQQVTDLQSSERPAFRSDQLGADFFSPVAGSVKGASPQGLFHANHPLRITQNRARERRTVPGKTKGSRSPTAGLFDGPRPILS